MACSEEGYSSRSKQAKWGGMRAEGGSPLPHSIIRAYRSFKARTSPVLRPDGPHFLIRRELLALSLRKRFGNEASSSGVSSMAGDGPPRRRVGRRAAALNSGTIRL